MKRLSYLLIASVLLGAHILAIPLGIAQLSAYRFMILASGGILLYKIVIKDPKLEGRLGHKESITPYQIFYLFWLFYAGLSILWVDNLRRWFVGMFFVGCGVFSILFISYFIVEESDLRKAFKVFFIMTIFHQMWAWVQTFQIPYPRTTFGNQNDLSTLLLAGLFVGLIFFIETNKLWAKFLLIVYFISGILLIEIAGSRANTLALIIGLLAIFVVKLFDFKMSQSIWYLIIIGIVVFILGLIVVPPFRTLIGSVLTYLFRGPIQPGASNRNRINMILNGLYFTLTSFGLGVGAGNIEHHLTNNAVLYVDAPNIHNWFMDILTGYGVIVFSLYIMMYIFILRRLFYNYYYSENKFINNTSLIIFGYLMAFIISSASSATNIIIEWQWVFWGIIIAFVQYTERYSSYENN